MARHQRPYVLDLMPGASMIEFLVNHGHDVYLLDWGEIAEEDKELGFEEGGLFRTWLDGRHFPADLIVERYNGLPASLMSAGFKMLRPTLEAQAISGLWANVNRPGYVAGYKAMSRWANDFIGMPGRFFTQLSKDLYAKNRLMNRDFVLNGRKVDLGQITQPFLTVAANQDFIVPVPAARRLMDAVSSEDKEYVEMPGGHISVFSGRQAHQTLWPKIDEWVSARAS